MSATLFMVPLKIEAMAVRAGAPATQIDQFGMGPHRADVAAARLGSEQHSLRPTVLLGVAGGLGASDRPGDVIVADCLGLVEGDDKISLSEAAGVAELISDARIEVRRGTVVSASAIVHGDANRQHAARDGALAVDMESYWCGALAVHRPFAVVRVLLDVPGRGFRSPAVISATREAYRSLKAVARVLAQWSPESITAYPILEDGDK